MKNLVFYLAIIFLASCRINEDRNLKIKIEKDFGLSEKSCANLQINLDSVNNRIIHYFSDINKTILFSDTIIEFRENIFLVHKLDPYTVLTYRDESKSLIQIYFENCQNGITLRSIKEIRDSIIMFKESNKLGKPLYKNISQFLNNEFTNLKLYDFGKNTHGRAEYYYQNCKLNIQLVHYWLEMKSRAPRFESKEHLLLKPTSYNGSIYLDISLLNRHDLDYDIQLDTIIIDYPKINVTECK